MSVDIKKVLLNLGEENAKVLIKDVLFPYAEEFLQKNPAAESFIKPFLAEIEAGVLGLVDKIDGEIG